MTEREALGVAFSVLGGARDCGAVADAIVGFCDASGLTFELLTMNTGGGVRQRKFLPKKLRGYVEDPKSWTLRLRSEARICSTLQAYLRDWKPLDDYETRFVSRWVCVGSDELPLAIEGPVLEFIEAMVRLYPVAHGAVGGYRALRYALHEFTNHANVMLTELDDETALRLSFDNRNHTEYREKLLRLYPVTIIGSAIWSKLPPLPPLEQPPIVSDLGDCKMLTCWPTLCEPRDPAFLRGTRALREWLWPYTIQNPADHVDNDPPAPP